LQKSHRGWAKEVYSDGRWKISDDADVAPPRKKRSVPNGKDERMRNGSRAMSARLQTMRGGWKNKKGKRKSQEGRTGAGGRT